MNPNLAFLKSLIDDQQQGYFKDFIATLPAQPKLAWYPASGNDFTSIRNLTPRYVRRMSIPHLLREQEISLYDPRIKNIKIFRKNQEDLNLLEQTNELSIFDLYHPRFGNDDFYKDKLTSRSCQRMQTLIKSPEVFSCPDLFILSDSSDIFGLNMIINFKKYNEERIKEIIEFEEVTPLYLGSQINKKLFYVLEFSCKENFEDHSPTRVFFMKVVFEDHEIIPILYISGTNEALCSKIFYPQQIEISHLIIHRCGGGLGGGSVMNGSWVEGVIRKLKSRHLLSENFHTLFKTQGEFNYLQQTYPNLIAETPEVLPAFIIQIGKHKKYEDLQNIHYLIDLPIINE